MSSNFWSLFLLWDRLPRKGFPSMPCIEPWHALVTWPPPVMLACARRYLPMCLMTIAIAMLQQFTGINAIMFYVPVLFSS